MPGSGFTKRGPFVQGSLPAANADFLNAVEDALDELSWHESGQQTGITVYAITWPSWARVIDVEVDGSIASATLPHTIALQPSGGGSSLNGRNLRKYKFINTVDTPGEGIANDSQTRDVGLALCYNDSAAAPADVLAKGTFSFRTGLGAAKATTKSRGAANASVNSMDLDGQVYTVATPATVTVKFNVGNAATFTGRIRWRFRA